MRQMAFYGKGGIGKSTVVGNITVCLAQMGYKVLHMGCDPKHDSTIGVLHGMRIQTVLDTAREIARDKIELDMIRIVNPNYPNMYCVEAGGPEPGIGCAGRGVISAIQILEQLDAYQEKMDFVVYDVLGDVVCGGFAMPIRESYAEEVYLLACGELMSLYAANNICKAIKRFAERGKTRLGGVVCNCRGELPKERELVEEFASTIGTKVVEFIPRDIIVQKAEINRMTLIEYAPDSKQAEIYRGLAAKIIENKEFCVPKPITLDDLEAMCSKYGMD